MKFALVSASLALLLISFHPEVAMSSDHQPVTLEWYGHSCFLLTLQNGAKILLDPYDTTRLPYSLPPGKVDLIFSTHDHFDHNAVAAVPSRHILRADGHEAKFFGQTSGTKTMPDSSCEVDLGGTKLACTTIPSFHDERKGTQRGANGMIRFTVEGLTFAHLGDLGDTLNADQIGMMKPVDVLLIPVGGYYTIDSTQAQKVVQQIQPRIVIPMHFKTPALAESFPISVVDPFLKGYPVVHRNLSSTITFEAGKLPADLTVEVLKYHGQK